MQAIIWDYFDISELADKKEIANLCAENVPALLASVQGLKTACGIFAISDKKERKAIVKSLKGHAKEMATNPIATHFLVKVITSYDDTVLCKKYVLNDLVIEFENLVDEAIANRMYVGLINPQCK